MKIKNVLIKSLLFGSLVGAFSCNFDNNFALEDKSLKKIKEEEVSGWYQDYLNLEQELIKRENYLKNNSLNEIVDGNKLKEIEEYAEELAMIEGFLSYSIDKEIKEKIVSTLIKNYNKYSHPYKNNKPSIPNSENLRISPFTILAQIYCESEFSRYAISNVGAAGMIQLMPETAEGYGLKVFKTKDYFKGREFSQESERLNSKAVTYFKKQFNNTKNLDGWDYFSVEIKDFQKGYKENKDSMNFYMGRYIEELKDSISQIKKRSKNKEQLEENLKKFDERFTTRGLEIGIKKDIDAFNKFDGNLYLTIMNYHAGNWIYNERNLENVPELPKYLPVTTSYFNDILYYSERFKKEAESMINMKKYLKNVYQTKKEQYKEKLLNEYLKR